jgi:hypothetical protein
MDFAVFEINVYEIPGKNTINLYIDDIKRRLDALSIKYVINDKHNASMEEYKSPAIDEIKTMNESNLNGIVSSIGIPSKKTDIDIKEGYLSMQLQIYDDTLEKKQYVGIIQLNNWLHRKETERVNFSAI